MSELIKVGMADSKICYAPDGLITLGLGSCIGIAIRDTKKQIGGLVHIMLPDSSKISQNSNVNKFADTGITCMVEEMIKCGARKENMVAKLAGGAQMFMFMESVNVTKIGDRNLEASREVLERLGIPILATDCGGDYGRTVKFYPKSGSFVISAMGKDVNVI